MTAIAELAKRSIAEDDAALDVEKNIQKLGQTLSTAFVAEVS